MSTIVNQPSPISAVLQKVKNDKYGPWNYLCDVWPQGFIRTIASTALQVLGLALFTQFVFTTTVEWVETVAFVLLAVLALALRLGDGLIAGYQTSCGERSDLVFEHDKCVQVILHLECRLKTAAHSVTTTRFTSQTGLVSLTGSGMREEACFHILRRLRIEFKLRTRHIDWNSFQGDTVVSSKTLKDVIRILDGLHRKYNHKRELVEKYNTVDVADVL